MLFVFSFKDIQFYRNHRVDEAAPEEAASEENVPAENAAPSEDAASPEEEPKAE